MARSLKKKKRGARRGGPAHAGVNVHAAKTHFSRLLARVERGEDVVISRAGRPVAKLVRIEPASGPRVLGQEAGRIRIAPGFDAPLTDEEFPT